MRKQWRCFHCDEVFTSRRYAAAHFGARETDQGAACKIRAHEAHLVDVIRRQEADLASYRADDSKIMRSIVTLESEHRRDVLRAEEEGYGRGVIDLGRMLRRVANLAWGRAVGDVAPLPAAVVDEIIAEAEKVEA